MSENPIISANHTEFKGKYNRLTNQEGDALEKLAIEYSKKIDYDSRFENALKTVEESSKRTASNVLIYHRCACCDSILLLVKSRTSFLSNKFVLKGLVCDNASCVYYHKFIPVESISKLSARFPMPMMTFATENYLKEHPNERT